MAEVEELLDGVVVRLPAAEEIRARGRRRSRRRATTAVVCTVALMAAGAWAVLPTGADQRHKHETVATTPDNPFRKDGVIQTMRADEVPLHGTWQWEEDERPTTGAGSQGDPLPHLGLDGACASKPPSVGAVDETSYGRRYTGRDGAAAQQCIVEYDDDATAREQLRKMGGVLESGGLRAAPGNSGKAEDGSGSWAGTVENGRTLRVFTRRWNSWISVTEVLDGVRGS
ncbi:hypothetical protein ACFCZT_10520 [Streptomyces sp. NPDC056230]|uniref:hypothetical protein n=1 Tax=Streptomyces sp. NPDC056230 TaxID=3345754 RepID=UPI0035D92C7D